MISRWGIILGGRGRIWEGAYGGSPELRKHVYEYCPEAKIGLDMDAAQYVPGDCNQNW